MTITIDEPKCKFVLIDALAFGSDMNVAFVVFIISTVITVITVITAFDVFEVIFLVIVEVEDQKSRTTNFMDLTPFRPPGLWTRAAWPEYSIDKSRPS
ncbi:hypothetical protein H9Q71_000440 [Fusarium xylarioides]|nr:hypothetical protein H9Q71_000440 [Fusarium xylarioides]